MWGGEGEIVALVIGNRECLDLDYLVGTFPLGAPLRFNPESPCLSLTLNSMGCNAYRSAGDIGWRLRVINVWVGS